MCVCTVQFSWIFCQFDFSTCPVELDELVAANATAAARAASAGPGPVSPWTRLASFAYAYLSALYYPLNGCKRNPVFLHTEFTLPQFLVRSSHLFSMNTSIHTTLIEHLSLIFSVRVFFLMSVYCIRVPYKSIRFLLSRCSNS